MTNQTTRQGNGAKYWRTMAAIVTAFVGLGTIAVLVMTMRNSDVKQVITNSASISHNRGEIDKLNVRHEAALERMEGRLHAIEDSVTETRILVARIAQEIGAETMP